MASWSLGPQMASGLPGSARVRAAVLGPAGPWPRYGIRMRKEVRIPPYSTQPQDLG